MKRVLIASPFKLGARASYIGTILDVMTEGIPDCNVAYVAMEGPAVNFQRNELAYYAVSQNYDRLVMVDEDMKLTRGDFVRLLSHDVPVVAGPYCVKRDGPPKWLYRTTEGAEQRPDGLVACDYVATGFISISTACLRAIADKSPERYFNRQEDADEAIAPRFDWFPMEVVGEGSFESRMRKVEAILTWAGKDEKSALRAIRETVESPQEMGRMLGEDYGFCRLARGAGQTLYVDAGMPTIPHLGEAAYPLRPTP